MQVCRSLSSISPRLRQWERSRATAVVPTHKIRTFDERFDPGGGGINVARVVHILGGDVLAVRPGT